MSQPPQKSARSWFLRFGRDTKALSDADVVADAVRGDRAASVELARRIGPILRARVLRATRGRPTGAIDVDDMVQEVWRRLFERDAARLRGYDPAQCSLIGYANLVAAQTISDLITAQRTQKRRPEGGFAGLDAVAEARTAAPNPERRVTASREANALWAHLDSTLADAGRLVLRALFVDHLSPEEVAERYNMKRATVDSWRFKAKKAALAWQAAQAAEGLS